MAHNHLVKGMPAWTRFIPKGKEKAFSSYVKGFVVSINF
jgi:hypothetical protein